MNTPESLANWLSEKVTAHRWAGPRQERMVTHSWFRATGGRNMRAALSASIRPSSQFSLEVAADDLSPEYIAGAKNGVVTVLMSQSWAPVLACSVTLFAFEAHSSDSSYAAFYACAKEATEQLLGVAPGFSHNIVW